MTPRTDTPHARSHAAVALRTVFLALLGVVHSLAPACADYMPMSGAEVANNIAEIHVADDGVRIQLEIFVGDARQFEALIPDAWFETDASGRPGEAERLADFAETGLTVRRGDGTALPVRVALIEPRIRVDRTTPLTGQRDPITGREFPKPPDDPRVVYAELLYDFDGTQPQVIEIAPPLDADGTPRVTIGMVVFDRGVPVTNFRFLSGSARLSVDWTDPWYSAFDNPNLRRHHLSGVTTYLYVEPRELRHETLIRVRDIDPWLGLDLSPGTQLSAADQVRIKEQAAAFLAKRNPVAIDARAATPVGARAELLTIDTAGLQIAEGDSALDADAAFLGVILSFPHDDLPQTVSVAWDMFSDRVTRVPATATDPAGPFLSGATPDAPEIVWTNHLLTYERPVVTPVPVGLAGRVQLPVLSVVLVLVGLAAAAIALPRRGAVRIATAGAMVAAVAGGWLVRDAATVPLRNPFTQTPGATAAMAAFRAVLENVNIAHLEVTPEARETALAPLVVGPAMEDVAAELDRALAVRVPGGGIARVTEVGGLALEDLQPAPQGFGFQALATWTAQAQAGHWGHSHRRIVAYRALVDIVEDAGHWKLTGITVFEAKTPDA